MNDERIDAVLDAWAEEKARADAAERRVLELEGILSRFLHAVGRTSFVPTPELEVVLGELEEYAGAK
jgi:hypothetical protein